MAKISHMNFLVIIVCAMIFLLLIQPGFSDIESPKKQISHGVLPEKVTCDQGLVLVLRPSDMPACVKPTTAEKFQNFGWTKIVQQFKNAGKQIEMIPATQGTFVNFYLTDNDLNISKDGVDVINAEELLEFTINGIPILGSKTMVETGQDTGKFLVRFALPDKINGESLKQDNVILIRYLDESDSKGEKRVLVKSIRLTNTFAELESLGGSRIGHEVTVRMYEPDANKDSKDEDKVPLSSVIFEAKGGIKTTLANPRLEANRPYLVETGPNTNIFEIMIKIPRHIDGKTIHIGDWYEIKYVDKTTPSNTEEEVILKGRVG